MKRTTLKIICLLIALFGAFGINAQSLVEDAGLSVTAEGVFNETIKIISNSKKIFVLTNNNQQLGPGDFISLALDNKLAARAVVGKTHQGQAGIKILKIYSLAQWGKLHRDQEVQIIKGDDSTFTTPAPTEKPQATRIKNEDDLFTGDVVVEDDLGDFDENKNRHIKPDNVVSAFGGFKSAENTESKGGSVRTNEFGVSWAYQFADNYFAEGLYGRAMFNDFPGDGNQTLVNHLVGRIKFNIKGPLYTFFMPYVGFQTFSVQSPDAGKTDIDFQNQEELDAVNKLKKSGPVFGITVLRRLVPGWFVKGDLGNDIINIGFAIEF